MSPGDLVYILNYGEIVGAGGGGGTGGNGTGDTFGPGIHTGSAGSDGGTAIQAFIPSIIENHGSIYSGGGGGGGGFGGINGSSSTGGGGGGGAGVQPGPGGIRGSNIQLQNLVLC